MGEGVGPQQKVGLDYHPACKVVNIVYLAYARSWCVGGATLRQICLGL